jgi:hypothetical protein
MYPCQLVGGFMSSEIGYFDDVVSDPCQTQSNSAKGGIHSLVSKLSVLKMYHVVKKLSNVVFLLHRS